MKFYSLVMCLFYFLFILCYNALLSFKVSTIEQHLILSFVCFKCWWNSQLLWKMMLPVFNFRAQVIIVVTWSCFCSEFQKMNHSIRLTVLYSPLGLSTSPQSKEQLRLKILSACLQQLARSVSKFHSYLFIFVFFVCRYVCVKLAVYLIRSFLNLRIQPI